ncbi:hypothetical protein SARC_02282, partial [Sphaeroforma arctica JP610]
MVIGVPSQDISLQKSKLRRSTIEREQRDRHSESEDTKSDRGRSRSRSGKDPKRERDNLRPRSRERGHGKSRASRGGSCAYSEPSESEGDLYCTVCHSANHTRRLPLVSGGQGAASKK